MRYRSEVAALMTEAIILRRLARPVAADRIILPGRCRAGLANLSEHFACRSRAGRMN